MPENSEASKDRTRPFWKGVWGMEYDLESKERHLADIFKELDSEEKLGNVIADIGSGASPVSAYVPKKEGRKIITVDMGGEETDLDASDHIQFDIEKIKKPGFATANALIKAANILDMNEDIRTASPSRVDTMLFSEVLNYVDYKPVLSGLTKFIKSNGRIIVMNKPNRTFEHIDETTPTGRFMKELLHERRPKDNDEVIRFLQLNGFEIEAAYYSAEAEPAKAMMTLVARKR